MPSMDVLVVSVGDGETQLLFNTSNNELITPYEMRFVSFAGQPSTVSIDGQQFQKLIVNFELASTVS